MISFRHRLLLSASVAALSFSAFGGAFAAPSGGVVAGGSADIRSAGVRTDIFQQSDKAVIDWQSFDIGVDEITQFHQPSSASTVLNRVVGGGDASAILGQLKANGNVFLINPNGILFGPNSRVDVGGLLASTADIRNEDFFANRYDFGIAGASDAQIINQGSITAREAGLVGLVAPSVMNQGVIHARLGRVELAAADSFQLDLYGDGLIQLGVSGDHLKKLVDNQGLIMAEGGSVYLTAAAARDVVDSLVRVSGDIEATSVHEEQGVIKLSADQGRVLVDNGSLDVSGINPGEAGGAIHVTGAQVGLTGHATLSADGATGGGEILLGGDYLGGAYRGNLPSDDNGLDGGLGGTSAVNTSGLGQRLAAQNGGEIITADVGYVGPDVTINANGTLVGNGGRVILWSDDTTRFHGTINAKGGIHSGDGGFVETSGKINLHATGTAHASAQNGKAGTWLLDPNNIAIQNAGPDTNIGGSPNFSTTDNSSVLTTASIEAALNAGTSVTVTTGTAGTSAQDGDINIVGDIDKTAGTDATLTLEAHDDIILGSAADIRSTSGALNLVFNADSDAVGGGIVQLNNSIIDTNDGDLTIGGGANPLTTAAIGNGTGTAAIGVMIQSQIDTGAGDVSIRGQGGTAAASSNHGIRMNSTGSITTTTGNITVVGLGGAAGTGNIGVQLNGSSGAFITTTSGNISITGTGGDNGASNHGISQSSAFDITSTGTGGGVGSITLNGTGGDGTSDNYGVYIATADSTITSVDGDIDITGMGGNGSSSSNFGISLVSEAAIISTGTTDDAANITLNGTGGDGATTSNQGVRIVGNTALAAGVDNTRITTVAGDISIAGTGDADVATGTSANYGIYLLNEADIISTGAGAGAGKITLDGTGSDGTGGNYGVYIAAADSTITSVDGDIDITGVGGDGSGGSNFGIVLTSESAIISTGTTDDAANITLNGTGGDGTSSNEGVRILGNNALAAGVDNTRITTVAGDISITGTGDADVATGTSNNFGIYLWNEADIISTGTGTGAGKITLDGTGGDGTSNNYGVYIATADSTITSVDGDIDITGMGGNGSGGSNFGIALFSEAAIISTGTTDDAANITLNGTGGDGATTSNQGVRIVGNTALAAGVDNTRITTVAGDISIAGTGDADVATGTSSNYGIYLLNEADIISTGTGAGAGKITINATGGNGTNNNYGFYGDSVDTTITSVDGDISITGNGGDGSGSNNWGIYLNGGIDITSTGTTTDAANITLDGTGGDGGSTVNGGIRLNTGSTSVTTSKGDISLTGQGGTGTGSATGMYIISGTISTADDGDITLNGTAGNGTGASNQGIHLNTNVMSLVDGDLTVTGTTQAGTTNNYGLNINRPNINITGSGDITMTGTAAGTGGTNYGVYMRTNGVNIRTNTGDIAISGTGANAAATDHGIIFEDDGTVYTNGTGSVTLTGTSSFAGASDIVFSAGATPFGNSTTAGGITLIGDSFSLTGRDISTTGAISVIPRTAGTSIGLAGGAGDLNLDATELGLFDAGGVLTIGDVASGTGLLTVNAHDFSADSAGVTLAGGAISVAGNVTTDGATTFQANSTDIDVAQNVTINSTNNAMLLRAYNDVNLNGTAGNTTTLDAGNGRVTLVGDDHAGFLTGGLNISADSDITTTGNVQLFGSNVGDMQIKGTLNGGGDLEGALGDVINSTPYDASITAQGRYVKDDPVIGGGFFEPPPPEPEPEPEPEVPSPEPEIPVDPEPETPSEPETPVVEEDVPSTVEVVSQEPKITIGGSDNGFADPFNQPTNGGFSEGIFTPISSAEDSAQSARNSTSPSLNEEDLLDRWQSADTADEDDVTSSQGSADNQGDSEISDETSTDTTATSQQNNRKRSILGGLVILHPAIARIFQEN